MEETKTLNTKLLRTQRMLKPILKDKYNPFFKSKNFDINTLLNELKPILTEVGLVVIQPIDGDKLRTIVIDADTAERLDFCVNIPPDPDLQKYGASITYLRRFSLQSFFALEAEDDDGNTATGNLNQIEHQQEKKELSKAIGNHPVFQEMKTCPKCNKKHNGRFPKCFDCWKLEKDGINMANNPRPIEEPLNEIRLEDIF